MNALNCRDKVLDISSPQVMGVLNVTPDSFYADSRYQDLDAIISRAEEMVNQGARIIDIGAMSSRPGAITITAVDEIKRLEHIMPSLRQALPNTILSLDTLHANVALKAITDWGVDMINDISASVLDDELAKLMNDQNVAYCFMHMQGNPETMQDRPQYQNLNLEIITFLKQKYVECKRFGLNNLLIDPGIGFGKSIAENYSIIKQLSSYKILGLPILVGLSRKSFIYNTLNTTAEDAINGTTAMHMLALTNGAKILRVHDVAEAKECVQLWQAYSKA